MADGTALVDRERYEPSLLAAMEAIGGPEGRALQDLLHPGSLDRVPGAVLNAAVREIPGAWNEMEATGASDQSRFHVAALPSSFVDQHGDWTVVFAVRPYRARGVYAVMAVAIQPPS